VRSAERVGRFFDGHDLLVAFGKSGNPRRYWAYEPSERLMPLLAAAGARLLVIGLALALQTLFAHAVGSVR
jgi:hypothetical protein